MSKYGHVAFTVDLPEQASNGMSRDRIVTLARQHTLPLDIVPECLTPRTAFSRAVKEVGKRLAPKGIFFKGHRNLKAHATYLVMEERVLGNKMSAVQVGTLNWRLEKEREEPDVQLAANNQDVCDMVATYYELLKGTISDQDWADSIRSFLDAFLIPPLRRDGRVFWVSPWRRGLIDRLRNFLEAGPGIFMMTAPVENQHKHRVEEQVLANFNSIVSKFYEEVALRDIKGKYLEARMSQVDRFIYEEQELIKLFGEGMPWEGKLQQAWTLLQKNLPSRRPMPDAQTPP